MFLLKHFPNMVTYTDFGKCSHAVIKITLLSVKDRQTHPTILLHLSRSLQAFSGLSALEDGEFMDDEFHWNTCEANHSKSVLLILLICRLPIECSPGDTHHPSIQGDHWANRLKEARQLVFFLFICLPFVFQTKR